jgi:hypothetical protein
MNVAYTRLKPIMDKLCPMNKLTGRLYFNISELKQTGSLMPFSLPAMLYPIHESTTQELCRINATWTRIMSNRLNEYGFMKLQPITMAVRTKA